jgi:hypothetical protein
LVLFCFKAKKNVRTEIKNETTSLGKEIKILKQVPDEGCEQLNEKGKMKKKKRKIF